MLWMNVLLNSSSGIILHLEYRINPTQWVGYDKAHCEPIDEVKTNQWVCA